jgi:plasmid maintenance system antidote protein VapI
MFSAFSRSTTRRGFGEVSRGRPRKKGLSISSLARSIGVPQSNLTDMLNGKRDWSKTAIRELSAKLNIRADRFLL